jgi:hypothetical protein
MSEHTVVSDTPAVAPYKIPGLESGATVDYIRFITFSDNTVAYRCSLCEKEFATFGACAAHRTHHFRTRESYVHAGTEAGRTRKNPNKVANTVEEILRNALYGVGKEISEAISGQSSDEVGRLNDKIVFLSESLSEEKKLRQQAEKDLLKIKNLFK